MKKSVVSILVCAGLASQAFAQAGQLDPTFGSGGLVANSPLTQFTAATLTPNGDILVAGGVSGTATLLRYLPSGALDPSFGSGGTVSLPAPASFFLGESFTLGIAVDSSERTLATFYAFNNTSTMSESVLIRLNANGTPDTTFGSGGQVPLSFPVPTGWGASATLVLAQPDGKILVTGNIVPPFRNHSAPLTLLARYLFNGALDTSFGSGGIEEEVAPVDLPTSLALLSGDGILALNGEGPLAASQFTSSGALLGSATGGTFIAADQTGETAFQSSSQYVAPGTIQGTEGKTNVDAIVERFDLNGEQDTTFQSPAIRFAPDAPNVKTVPAAIGVDSESRILVGAELESANFGSGVARLNPNGSLDTTFGAGGIGAIVSRFVVYAVLVQPDNKTVMIGGTGNLARYLAK